jgi:hypothetical protein
MARLAVTHVNDVAIRAKARAELSVARELTRCATTIERGDPDAGLRIFFRGGVDELCAVRREIE